MTPADGRKTKAELIAELAALRSRVEGVPQNSPAYHAGVAEAILASTPDHVYMYDRDMRYRYASAAGLRTLGLTADAVIGKTWRELGFPPEVMEPLENEVRTVFSTGASITNETAFPIATGYQYVLSPVHNASGDITGVASHVRDVTGMSRLRRSLDAVAAAVRAKTGEEFFGELVVRLSAVLGMRYAFIEEFVDSDRTRVRAAVWPISSQDRRARTSSSGRHARTRRMYRHSSRGTRS